MIRRYVVGFLFPLDKPGHVVLLKKSTEGKPGVEWQDGLWNGLGGKVEDGEMPEAAMARECAEEVDGLRVDWVHVAVLTDGTFQLDVFRADCAMDEIPAENDVGERYAAARIDSVVNRKARTIPNLQWLVPMCMGADRAFWPFSIIQGVPGE